MAILQEEAELCRTRLLVAVAVGGDKELLEPAVLREEVVAGRVEVG